MVSYTPMLKQYLQIKQNYQDAILFFRLGDFYEMFFDDALVASRELEITLTGRDAGAAGRVPMCGVPYHAADTYIARLIERGYKVAICDQVEDPADARGIVRREVTRVVTPGTIMECLEERKHNFLAAVVEKGNAYGLAVVDVTTGLFMVTQIDGRDALLDELIRLEPAEVLLPDIPLYRELAGAVKSRLPKAVISFWSPAAFERGEAVRSLQEQLGTGWTRSGLSGLPLAILCAGGMLNYLKATQKRELGQINRVEIYSGGQYMHLDGVTRRNLELTSSLRDGSRWGTLLWVLDHTVTAMGGRLLKSWLERPLLDVQAIRARQDAVEELVNDSLARQELQHLLKTIYDLERLSSRVVYGTAGPRDLLALKNSLAVLPKVKKVLCNKKAPLWQEIAGDLDCLEDVVQLLDEAIDADPPAGSREGGIIREGYHPEVDRLRQASREGKNWLAQLEAREKERTGIRSLKVGFNKVFGYYLEVTRPNLDLVPADYIRKQTLAGAERFITPELKELEEQILGAEERLVQLEYRLFTEIREKVAAQVRRIQQAAGAVARTDALLSLAEAAVKGNYVRPEVNDGSRITIREGRHPVVEQVLEPGEFVPNDVDLGGDTRLILLTGPNMAGKSTYMRQVALLVLMAQVGSFIPAASGEIGIVDRIFTRVGASDDLAAGQSTFMVEMSECQVIVSAATPRSLIIMDEVGRGTSTYDGISIARALVEYIVRRIGARTLFSTHYHELTELDVLPGVKNFTVAVEERGEDVVFLRRVRPGRADRSYGIQVARLAGLPGEILQRAEEILHELEYRRDGGAVSPAPRDLPAHREEKTAVPKHPILDELVKLDLWQMTPLEALNTLAAWQRSLKQGVRRVTGHGS
ncbi:DNA mismatch repair protein mutS [Desulfofundulus kuznetsovii DSM 6115]|uniref:DNA mismatch repair protein MutS n=2 Tax=Desulfofundulus kuznetsovii TaxID=58135 RepID=A0AAU8PAB5_DESK7|nr:DNA mismatch repair protein mutS [Desulfofundulus kuznetsovii DSM 6115]